MSLTALSIVSRDSTPLYLRDYANNETNLVFNNLSDSDLFDQDIPASEETTTKAEWPCQLKYQFILHSACQRLEDILKENKWRLPGAPSGMDACWVGFLCSSDNFRAYGELH